MDTAVLFTEASAFSLAGVASIAVVAVIAANAYLRNARWQDRWTFIWLAFDALIHFAIEGPYVFLSTSGRQVNTSTGLFAEMWKEYAAADYRWGHADPTIVAMELLALIGSGPLCVYIIILLFQNDPARHYWLIVLSVIELYAGWICMVPELLTGSENLNTSNPLHLWVYLGLLNSIWVIVPVWIMYESYTQIVGVLRVAELRNNATQTEKALS